MRRSLTRNFYWIFLLFVAFGSTAIWVLSFLYLIVGESTPLSSKPIHPVSVYHGLQFSENARRVPLASEIDSVRQHAIMILGLDSSYVERGKK